MRRFLVLLVFGLTMGVSAQDLTVCGQNISRLGEVVSEYYTESGGKFPVRLSDLSPGFVQTVPTCPVSGQPYSFIPSQKDFRIYCKGKGHGIEGAPPNHPSYYSSQGLIPFKIAERHARGQKVYIPGHSFVMPKGWLKVSGNRSTGVTLQHVKDRSEMSAGLSSLPPAPSNSRLNNPNLPAYNSYISYSLAEQGYLVNREEIFRRAGIRGYQIEASLNEEYLVVVAGSDRNGRFFQFSFRGFGYQQRNAGSRALRALISGLRTERE